MKNTPPGKKDKRFASNMGKGLTPGKSFAAKLGPAKRKFSSAAAALGSMGTKVSPTVRPRSMKNK